MTLRQCRIGPVSCRRQDRTALLSAQGMPGPLTGARTPAPGGPDGREVQVAKRGDPGQPGDARQWPPRWHRRCQADDQETFPRVRPCSRCRRPRARLEPVTADDRKNVTSARGLARDGRRHPIPPRVGEGTSSGPFANGLHGFRWSGAIGRATAPASPLLNCGFHCCQGAATGPPGDWPRPAPRCAVPRRLPGIPNGQPWRVLEVLGKRGNDRRRLLGAVYGRYYLYVFGHRSSILRGAGRSRAWAARLAW